MLIDEDRIIISKSRYLSGLQCPKLLWYQFKERGTIPPPDADTLAVFEQGHRVGELAQSLFPDGIFVLRGGYRIGDVLAATRKLTGLRKPLFEAGFLYGGAYARVDILNPVSEDEWDLYEVKSSTRVKDEHLSDVAFQRYVLEGAGIKIRAVNLMYIDRDYRREGELDPAGLFGSEDLTRSTDPLLPGIPVDLELMEGNINEEKAPDICVGRQCTSPNSCAMVPICWEHLPEQNVTTLVSGKARGFSLIQQGITHLRDVPQELSLTGKQKIQLKAVRSGKVHIEKAELTRFLDGLVYPLYFLDFETISPAIPVFQGTRPYARIPFQFSVQVQQYPGKDLADSSFLAEEAQDPRPGFLAALKKELGPEGSIVVYNAPFEKGVLTELAGQFPEYDPWIHQLLPRLADLLVPFRNFVVYHPAQLGSASLKSVLPALTGSGYEGMDIAGGMAASNEYFRVIYTDVPEDERRRVIQSLKIYCRQDTEGMAEILKVLYEMVG